MDDAKLQLLLDRAEISDVQLRYATGLDMRDWTTFRSCFADEIEVDFTSAFGGEPRHVTADRWTEAARRTMSGLRATQHMITNHVITVDGARYAWRTFRRSTIFQTTAATARRRWVGATGTISCAHRRAGGSSRAS